MSKKRNNTSHNAKPNGLAGWVFLILEGNQIAAQGQILGSIGSHHVVQFQGIPTYTRVMNPAQMEILTLFPNGEQMQGFLSEWIVENQPHPPADDTDVACDEGGPSADASAAAVDGPDLVDEPDGVEPEDSSEVA